MTAQRHPGDYQPASGAPKYGEEGEADVQAGPTTSGYGSNETQPGSTTSGYGSNETQPGSTTSGYGSNETQLESAPEETYSPPSRSGDSRENRYATSGGISEDAQTDRPDTKINFSDSDGESPSREYREGDVQGASTKDRRSKYNRGDDTSSDRWYLKKRFPQENFPERTNN